MMTRLTLTAAILAAGLLAGCGTHVAPTSTMAASSLVAADAAKTAHKGPKASAKRTAPPAVKADKKPARQGIAASQAARACDNALAQYQSLQYQWQTAWSDFDKDQIETQMLNVLHQGLEQTQSITSAQGVDMADRRSYDIADQGLNRYDASYSQWQATWDDTSKRYIVNQMLTDMVNTLQQIRNNY